MRATNSQWKRIRGLAGLHKPQDKPYHIDYCFVSEHMADNIESEDIGDFGYWRQYSNDVPEIDAIPQS